MLHCTAAYSHCPINALIAFNTHTEDTFTKCSIFILDQMHVGKKLASCWIPLKFVLLYFVVFSKVCVYMCESGKANV